LGQAPAAPQQHQEKLDSAVEFLERVKIVYADQPVVYNQFLDIMKGFKTHTIDTTGVIRRVKQLFKGHPELTRGFAAFLPKEYKIDVEHDDEGEDGDERAGMAAHQQFTAQQQAVQAQVQAQQMVAAQAARPPVEVGEEHARLYVKKIKNRFVNQQHIYKNFLEILHTFHREKHSIQEVYAQVATLFRDHPDLLGEFAHFLPDPNAQQPLQLQHQQAQQQHFAQPHHDEHHLTQQHKQPARGAGTRGGRVMTEPPSRVPSRAQTGSAMAQTTLQHGVAGARGGLAAVSATTRGAAALAAPPPLHAGAPGADGANKERSHGTFDELSHFFKLKQVLPQNDYEEFLKLLAMYNADVLTKAELYFMVRDLLRHQDLELLDWFRKFMQVEDLKDEDSHGYLADYDWSASEKLGPSYRSMPRPWAQWKCSGRQGNAICAEVLNDAWISVPTGSEEGAFKNSRKNQYEELLFKCEDDRFELDLLVEGNASAIRALEITLNSFRTLSPSALATFQLNESDLSVLTIKAIRRVYANRADEFIKMIMGKPAVAIPVVLARLKAKDTEWNIARREWNVLWKQIFKKNYHKQLDHRSATFKQEEKKMLTAKALFAELRRASTEQKPNGGGLEKSEEVPSKMDVDPAAAAASDAAVKGDAVAAAAAASAASQSAVGSPTLSFVVAQPHLFADIRHLLLTTFTTQFPKADVNKFNTLWAALICAFFHVDPSLKSLAVVDETSGGAEKAAVTAAAAAANGGASSSGMDVDTTGSSAAVDSNLSGGSAVVKSETSNANEASSSSSMNGPVSSATNALFGTQNAPNKPISTELASKPATHHMLFLGNDSFYLLFRYLQILYDRMAEAWMFSEEYPQIHHVPIVEIDPKLPLTETPAIATANAGAVTVAFQTGAPPPAVLAAQQNYSSGRGSPAPQGPLVASSSSAVSAKREADDALEPLSSSTEPQAIIYSDAGLSTSPVSRYQNFLKNAEQLVAGTLEQQTFEERSRHDFGISCFPLFTIDKLLLLLAKQFHAVNSDETSEKLAGLYHYEVSRNMGGFTDAVYLSNCREVLSNDKHAYVFTFDWSNDSQILGITEVDLGHPSFGLEHNEELSNYINKLATNESVLAKKAARLSQLNQVHHAATNAMKVDPSGADSNSALDAASSSNGTKPAQANGADHSLPPSRDSPSPSVPFLRRNVAEAEGVLDEEHPPVIQNDLGVKIVPGTFKLRFVGNTEDSLHKPGRKTGHSPSNDKIEMEALTENASLPSPMDS
jgi:histone deacetylase complex regulatory component SIN3